MTPLTWLWLALAVLVVPVGNSALPRAWALADRGRLESLSERRERRRIARFARGADTLTIGAPLLVASLVTLRAGPALGLAAAVSAMTLAYLGRFAVRCRAARRADAQLVATVRIVVAELAAGSRPAAALDAAAGMSSTHAETFAAAAECARSGDEVDEVLARDPPLAAVAVAWRLATVTGAPLAAVLARAGEDLAARVQQQRVVTGALASARSSAAVLAVLPLVGVALGSGLDAHPLAFLLASPAGRWVTLVGVVLDAAGLLWTQLLTLAAQRR
jgi:tight adherence protein B